MHYRRISIKAAAVAVMAMLVFTASPAWSQEVLTVSAVGDVMMGSAGRMPADDGKSLFSEVREYLWGRDIVFFNHEGTLTDRGSPTKKIVKGRSYVFRTPPHYAKYLAEAGFNVVSLANNHAFDYGMEGKKQTFETLKNYGIVWSDPGPPPARFEVRGKKIIMAGFYVSSLAPYNINDLPAAVKIIQDLAAQSDVLIISVHAGAEGLQAIHTPDHNEKYLGENRGNLIAFSHAAVDAGADLILGHGPHVPRAMEIYKDRLIAYSLGNFCTMGFSTQSYYGLAPLLQAELAPDGRVLGGRVVSFVQKKGRGPVLDPKNQAAKLIFKLGQEDFPKSKAVADDGTIRPATSGD